ncbi:hypothetical protein SAMN03159496_00100 [Rhizobium sp. NFR07]|nr:hypothetical protein SAMN03159496_00100 [Rhizobium sp. NFR07]
MMASSTYPALWGYRRVNDTFGVIGRFLQTLILHLRWAKFSCDREGFTDWLLNSRTCRILKPEGKARGRRGDLKPTFLSGAERSQNPVPAAIRPFHFDVCELKRSMASCGATFLKIA